MPYATEIAWSLFLHINGQRRAIRDFDGGTLEDEEVRAILEQALLAPSSGNVQTYELHWTRDPELKAAVARACENQRAAASASTLVVIVARRGAGERTLQSWQAHVESTDRLDGKAKDYYLGQIRKFRRFLQLAPRIVWSPLKTLLTLIWPTFTLLPVGPSGMKHWVTRSSLYAAQTLLLAASARGIDSCPMEGFSARKVAELLKLPRDAVVPLVIALGHRRADARVDPRWRRTFEEAIVVH